MLDSSRRWGYQFLGRGDSLVHRVPLARCFVAVGLRADRGATVGDVVVDPVLLDRHNRADPSPVRHASARSRSEGAGDVARRLGNGS